MLQNRIRKIRTILLANSNVKARHNSRKGSWDVDVTGKNRKIPFVVILINLKNFSYAPVIKILFFSFLNLARVERGFCRTSTCRLPRIPRSRKMESFTFDGSFRYG